jgi:hypothetical protein
MTVRQRVQPDSMMSPADNFFLLISSSLLHWGQGVADPGDPEILAVTPTVDDGTIRF